MPSLTRLKNAIFRSRPKHEAEPDNALAIRLDAVDQLLQKVNKRGRRQAQLLESMRDELTAKMDAVHSKINADLPYESICAFARHFALYALGRKGSDPDLDTIWSAFSSLLRDLDVELILDHNRPFDDTRHQTCDTRFEPNRPEGVILEVVQPGILIQGRVRDFALVVVNKAEGRDSSQTLLESSQTYK